VTAQADTVLAQRFRIAAYLRRNIRATVDELRTACDIPSVTVRVSEMRKLGYRILTERTTTESPDGKRLHHGTAQYVWQGECPQPDLFENQE
jgi:Helix-turn-helix domain